MNPDYDIVICGGGMVGLTAACLLQQRAAGALRIAVIEAFAPPADDAEHSYQPSFDDRSTAFAAKTRQLYESLGLWSAIAPRATAIRRIHVSEQGRFGVTRLQAEDYGLDALGAVVENRWLGQVLARRVQQLEQVTWIAPAQVQRLTPGPEGVEVHLKHTDSPSEPSNNEPLRARVAIIADGAASPLAQTQHIRYRRFDYGQSALIANVDVIEGDASYAYERFTQHGPLALLPLPPMAAGAARYALVWTLPPAEAETLTACDEPHFLAQLQQAFGHRAGRFVRVGQRVAYPLQLVQSELAVQQRLALVGNALHSIHPVAGQGFNLAVRGLERLVDTLTGKAVDDPDYGSLAHLRSYADAHQPDQQQVITLTHELNRLFSNQSRVPLAGWRHLGLVGLDVMPVAKRALAFRAMGFGSALAEVEAARG